MRKKIILKKRIWQKENVYTETLRSPKENSGTLGVKIAAQTESLVKERKT